MKSTSPQLMSQVILLLLVHAEIVLLEI